MPDINMQVFEEARRNQLVTEVNIQTLVALDDYQVQLSDIANLTQSQDNVVIDRFGEFLPHWNESLDFNTWVKMSMEIAGKRILAFHGNSSINNISNGTDTFIQWHGAATSNFLDSLVIDSSSYVYEVKARRTSSGADDSSWWGIGNAAAYNDDNAFIQSYNPGSLNRRYLQTGNEGTRSEIYETPALSQNVWYRGKIVWSGSGSVHGYWDDDEISTGISTNIPNETMGLKFYIDIGTAEQSWSFVRKYTATEPIWSSDGEQNIAVALKSLGRAG